MGGRKQNYKFQPAPRLELTDECQNYQTARDVPWDLQKYFSQRYSIFSLYDYGVCLTGDAWFGVTPEPVANQIANDMYGTDASKVTIIDMFAGAGGNTIAFAGSERWDRIIGIEKDASTLACAQTNAEIYGIEEGTISWVHGDSLEFLDTLINRPELLHPDLRVDTATTVIFASPPWGGPGYRTDEIFNLDFMEPYNLQQLHTAAGHMDHALYLPRTSDIRQLAKLVPKGENLEVVQYCMEGASKAMVAYFLGRNSRDSVT